MEKVQNSLKDIPRKGKNLISATTILEITLEDYHQSRQLYGQQGNNVNMNNLKINDKREVKYYFKIFYLNIVESSKI
jgi:hypothetical protein